ncbi:MAG: IS4 family transposase, partial [Anaerolineales bacterium]|nr:IS4 family transposase [Anaerolineales bacterium]
ILNLPLMVAAVLTMLWRQVPSVHELNRMLAREDLLWGQAVKVSQQALSQRFLSFPAVFV